MLECWSWGHKNRSFVWLDYLMLGMTVEKKTGSSNWEDYHNGGCAVAWTNIWRFKHIYLGFILLRNNRMKYIGRWDEWAVAGWFLELLWSSQAHLESPALRPARFPISQTAAAQQCSHSTFPCSSPPWPPWQPPPCHRRRTNLSSSWSSQPLFKTFLLDFLIWEALVASAVSQVFLGLTTFPILHKSNWRIYLELTMNNL